MGDMFRSEKMSLCQVFLQPEAAYETIAQFGEEGCVQFRDMNDGLTSYQRKFVSEVRRCDEMERKIRFIENEIRKDDITIPELEPEAIPPAPKPREMIDLEAQLEKTEKEIIELAQNDVKLKSNYLELTEMLRVLEKTQSFFEDQQVVNMELSKNADDHHAQGGGHLGFVAGVVSRDREFAFERMLWRVARGNVYVKRSQLEESLKDPKTGSVMYKTVFVVFFQGEQLRSRVKKICTGFHASMYPCPEDHFERNDMIKGLRTRLDDLKVVLQQTEDQRKCVLTAVCNQLSKWAVMVQKMKAVYHVMNLLNQDVTSKCLIGECWVPNRDLPAVQFALAEGSKAAGSHVPSFLNVVETNDTPPTYYRTNKFTRGFQNLIDAYGVATYREANPGLYTCITFPFLFAVMFGDMGHGFILFLFGLWMVVDEKKLGRKRGGEIWNIFFAGRYIILLMGLFAVYTGFHYNDMFSKSINVFGTTWRVRYNRTTVLTNAEGLTLDPRYATDGVYVMGMDPIWQFADNKIIFLNTYKMKLSIIFGVLHMVFGVCMSVVNFVYFKRYANILLEFLPQMIFLLLLFGYMVFMMFYKWVKYSPHSEVLADTPGCAPSVLIMFINMVLFKSSEVSPGCDPNMFAGQTELEMIFVIVAVICIPWMLIGKPLYIKYTRKHKPQHPDDFKSTDTLEMIEGDTAVVVEVTETSNRDPEGGHGGHDDEPMSEIWIHQAIHTIEYVLSTISHTASYLRLWALSLAHAQLSEVLWTMVLSLALQMKGYVASIAIFFIFAIWVFFTMAIMVMMEGLSAFLHTLRLHWVEFMSKFYEGAGVIFQPFSFKTILQGDEED
ncbi:V-type proton ATPase 116 kDa subunit a1-like [Musca vetustissima]|uniref:V-type proton ATPase 116 kDa subunit a1-like n=1 Tax=Musca vetustissima TaxID=27455 RepID=UPI002AB60B1F|nr:V-type proton ATPase 116 kDa subunit a1-like [Musca vetustissima]